MNGRPISIGAGAIGAAALGGAALGAIAAGACAIGAAAVGVLVIGKLKASSAHFERVEIDELVVRKLILLERSSGDEAPEFLCRQRVRNRCTTRSPNSRLNRKSGAIANFSAAKRSARD